MIGQLGTVVLDCPEPRALAQFYSELLGWPVTYDGGSWVDIADGSARQFSFQQAPDYRRPQWPDPASSMQFHLDINVADLDQAESQVLALGATKLPGTGQSFRVYADPAGHPFCLVQA